MEIESYLKDRLYNKVKRVPVFYFNHSGLIFFSFNYDWIDCTNFNYRNNENLSNSEQLLDFEYTFFFYEEKVVINWILNLLKANNENFNDLINDSKLDTELCLLSDLVLKIFRKPKSFD